jgi:hypothetical protein
MRENNLNIRWKPFARDDLKRIPWIVEGLIPAGMLSIVEGIPASGKSTWLSYLVRCVTSGEPFAGHAVQRGRVLFAGSEESMSITALRCLAAGSAPGMAGRLEMTETIDSITTEKAISFPSCIEQVEAVVKAMNEREPENAVRLLVLDTASAALDPDIDQHKESATRQALGQLVRMAERHGVAVQAVRHLTKNGARDAVGGGLGSIALQAMARSILRCQRSKGGEYFAQVTKATYSAHRPKFQFWIGSAAVEMPNGGNETIGIVERVEELTDEPKVNGIAVLSAEAEQIANLIVNLVLNKLRVPAPELRQAVEDAGFAYESRPAREAKKYARECGRVLYDDATKCWHVREPSNGAAL